MTGLKCKNCGAPLNSRNKCEYCGTQYEIKNVGSLTTQMQIAEPEAIVLGAQISIKMDDLYRIPQEEVECIVLRKLSNLLVAELLPYMKLDEYDDPFTMQKKIRATIRVMERDRKL